MSKTIDKTSGDVVIREVWRVKDELSAAYGHSVDRLFEAARERQKISGHRVINLQRKRRTAVKS